jgi:hypothetical protein
MTRGVQRNTNSSQDLKIHSETIEMRSKRYLSSEASALSSTHSSSGTGPEHLNLETENFVIDRLKSVASWASVKRVGFVH